MLPCSRIFISTKLKQIEWKQKAKSIWYLRIDEECGSSDSVHGTTRQSSRSEAGKGINEMKCNKHEHLAAAAVAVEAAALIHQRTSSWIEWNRFHFVRSATCTALEWQYIVPMKQAWCYTSSTGLCWPVESQARGAKNFEPNLCNCYFYCCSLHFFLMLLLLFLFGLVRRIGPH